MLPKSVTLVSMKSFSERISLILQHYDLQPKDLAEKCGVQRSAISHLINGRNRPSVTFLSSLSDMYPELDTRWLLHGKGEMFTNVSGVKPPVVGTVVNTSITKENVGHLSDTNVTSGSQQSEAAATAVQHDASMLKPSNGQTKEIQRIIVFYNDGTFDSYNPQTD